MKQPQMLFDANAIYRLIRDYPDDALNHLAEGLTINLAYYELGNALWRESFLLKRISEEDAKKSLYFTYEVLERMQIATINSEKGRSALDLACKLNLTFYDSAYLTEAKAFDKTLVTDDKKLAKAAEKIGVKTLPSTAILNNR
ncbi:MAG TPA: type II toxin-antitoxin system VapC family toxin [Candidatus Nanoarchaeia archaeon]|nr:type II toxin-antitoxin system VapC family toxin [Candidatus Nanoarchaeia archaeon]